MWLWRRTRSEPCFFFPCLRYCIDPGLWSSPLIIVYAYSLRCSVYLSPLSLSLMLMEDERVIFIAPTTTCACITLSLYLVSSSLYGLLSSSTTFWLKSKMMKCLHARRFILVLRHSNLTRKKSECRDSTSRKRHLDDRESSLTEVYAGIA